MNWSQTYHRFQELGEVRHDQQVVFPLDEKMCAKEWHFVE
jgi:hypothetical protein